MCVCIMLLLLQGAPTPEKVPGPFLAYVQKSFGMGKRVSVVTRPRELGDKTCQGVIKIGRVGIILHHNAMNTLHMARYRQVLSYWLQWCEPSFASDLAAYLRHLFTSLLNTTCQIFMYIMIQAHVLSIRRMMKRFKDCDSKTPFHF